MIPEEEGSMKSTQQNSKLRLRTTQLLPKGE
jgi:hypothetical protein